MQERLPAEWRAFAGKPMLISYYDKRINTFRENPALGPSAAYVRSAVTQLREQLAAYNGMIYVRAPAKPGNLPVLDEIATPPRKKKTSKA
ncbi:hypothetical protein P43SY_006682 [Pythium insidiosum]|uniref:Uncharacterized protein n=1 Tax=Pythium insidiosum TaxID=114742 RepID=A0AAD5MAD9_PYTIN|nr:hypothetical protein P43SY_006682 [Pythium insidiosum]